MRVGATMTPCSEKSAALLIVILELFANALFWVVAGILFGRNADSRPVLNLALLAWVCIGNLQCCILALAQ
jgi:hypothetical protein